MTRKSSSKKENNTRSRVHSVKAKQRNTFRSCGRAFHALSFSVVAGLSFLPLACAREISIKKNLRFPRKAPNLNVFWSLSTNSYGRNTMLRLGIRISGIDKQPFSSLFKKKMIFFLKYFFVFLNYLKINIKKHYF